MANETWGESKTTIETFLDLKWDLIDET
jgi:hypothetical protein